MYYVPKKLRAELHALLPALAGGKLLRERKNGERWTRLLLAMLRHEWTDPMPVSQKYLSTYVWRLKALRNVEGELSAFRSKVLPAMRWEDAVWTANEHRPYRIVEHGIPAEVWELFAQVPDGEPEVFMDTGEALTAEALRRREDELLRLIPLPASYEATEIQRYHHDLPADWFQGTFSQNMKAAVAASEALESPTAARLARWTLYELRTNPKPLYSPTDKADRLFPVGSSFVGLKKEVRRELCAGWLDVDIASSQLTILSSPLLLDLSAVREVLEKDRSIWVELLGVGYTPEEKATAKTALYSICYGAGLERLAKNWSCETLTLEAFMAHPLLVELWAKRAAFMERLMREPAVNPLTGKPIEGDAKVGKLLPPQRMALYAQAWELRLLYAVYEARAAWGGFDVMAYLYDGVMLRLSPGDEAVVLGHIEACMNEAAEELAVTIHLEAEWLP